MSSGTAFLLNALLPRPVSVIALLARVVFIIVASFIVLAVVDRQARKLLPLAALLQLSLLFPDQMPNRFKLALRAGSGRRMAREVEQARAHGLSDDRGLAAQQLVLLATAIGDHDRRTRGHSERVRLFADLVAVELGLGAAERSKLQWAALIHDIGKITVPAEILNKKGAPTKREWEILRTHPANGEALAAPVAPWLGEWVHAIGGHHEKWDGTGYPRGLAGQAIPRAAAIVAVADSFEVMTAVRSYKKAMPLVDARAELTRCAGTHFDPDIVRALLNVSIGRLRGAMGIFAGLAHVPFIGPLTTAAAHAPDTVTAAVGATTSGATAGLSMAAIGGAMVLGPTSPTGPVAAAPAPVSVMSAPSVATLLTADVVAAAVPEPAAPQPAVEASASRVAAVNRESVASPRTTVAAAPTTTAAPVQQQAVPAPPLQTAEVATEAAAVDSDSDKAEGSGSQEAKDDERRGREDKSRWDAARVQKASNGEKAKKDKGQGSANPSGGDRRGGSGKKSSRGSRGKDD
jgi:HD-GYP domain-containing protein (c-di-GMP phosphodiesterase class II)